MAMWNRLMVGVVEEVVGPLVYNVSAQLLEHFQGHGDVLEDALRQSHDQAWQAVEAGLAGKSFWAWCRQRAEQADRRRLAQAVEGFVDQCPSVEDPAQRRYLLACLRTAKAKGLLSVPGGVRGESMIRQLGEQAQTMRAQLANLEPAQRQLALVEHLRDEGSDASSAGSESAASEPPASGRDETRLDPELVSLVSTPMPSGRPFLLELCRAFFLIRLQNDEVLARTLDFIQAERVSDRFAQLDEALSQQGQAVDELMGRMEEFFDQLLVKTDQVHASVQSVDERLQQLSEEVRSALSQHRLGEPVQPNHSFSIRNDAERRAVKQLLARFRELPADRQDRAPQLLTDLGKLLIGTGDLEEAQRSFHEAAEHSPERNLQAEARYNAYRAALERADWDAALADISSAAELDPARFAPFPMDRYRPQRILGAGGFGAAFLCVDEFLDAEVVVKALHDTDLDRSPRELFVEAQALMNVNHPVIIKVRHCDFAGVDQSRPYLVMEYFPGRSLQSVIDQDGTLPTQEALGIGVAIAEGMQAAHTRGILHRDLKPDNVLVKRTEGGTWRVKLIDFGLALKQPTIQASVQQPSTASRSILGSSIAGTLEYAPPEQMGKLAGVAVGPASDIYSFGKLLSYAMFRRTEPRRKHLAELPEPIADLLEQCIEEDPTERPQAFHEVVGVLRPRLAQAVHSEQPADADPVAEANEPTQTASPAQQAPESASANRPHEPGSAPGSVTQEDRRNEQTMAFGRLITERDRVYRELAGLWAQEPSDRTETTRRYIQQKQEQVREVDKRLEAMARELGRYVPPVPKDLADLGGGSASPGSTAAPAESQAVQILLRLADQRVRLFQQLAQIRALQRSGSRVAPERVQQLKDTIGRLHRKLEEQAASLGRPVPDLPQELVQHWEDPTDSAASARPEAGGFDQVFDRFFGQPQTANFTATPVAPPSPAPSSAPSTKPASKPAPRPAQPTKQPAQPRRKAADGTQGATHSGKSGYAEWCFWLGLFSVVPGMCPCTFATLSIGSMICYYLAMWELSAKPGLSGRSRAAWGFRWALVGGALWVLAVLLLSEA